MFLFLDVDGVLNSSATANNDFLIEDNLLENVATFACACASAATSGDCRIVVTSSWRDKRAPMKLLVDALARVKLSVYAVTNKVPVQALKKSSNYAARCYARCLEIQLFLQAQPPVNNEWIVLDDMHLFMHDDIKKRLIRTRRHDGFTCEKLTQALLLLKRITNTTS